MQSLRFTVTLWGWSLDVAGSPPRSSECLTNRYRIGRNFRPFAPGCIDRKIPSRTKQRGPIAVWGLSLAGTLSNRVTNRGPSSTRETVAPFSKQGLRNPFSITIAPLSIEGPTVGQGGVAFKAFNLSHDTEKAGMYRPHGGLLLSTQPRVQGDGEEALRYSAKLMGLEFLAQRPAVRGDGQEFLPKIPRPLREGVERDGGSSPKDHGFPFSLSIPSPFPAWLMLRPIFSTAARATLSAR